MLHGSSSSFKPVAQPRRASKACGLCRRRKIRCDARDRGSRCSNCRMAGSDCWFLESKHRGRRPLSSLAKPTNIDRARTSIDGSAAFDTDLQYLNNPQLDDTDHNGISIHAINAEYMNILSQETFPVRGSHHTHMTDSSCIKFTWPLDSFVEEIQTFLGPLEKDIFDNASINAEGGILEGREPEYFQQPIGEIPDDQATFLKRKGALSLIPTPELRNGILQAYVKWVHPFLPVLDLRRFLCDAVSSSGASISSPLLYYAVMFAGSAFADLSCILAGGYSSRDDARNAFFEKTRLLYALDTEPDLLIQVQALLLLTFWPDDDDHKNAWYWVGIAYSVAQRAGLHLPSGPHVSSSSPSENNSLRIRLWWCLYVRDRFMSLGLRQSMHIKETDFDVLMLEEAHFTIEEYDYEPQPAMTAALGRTAAILLPDSQRQLAVIFVQQVKLSIPVGRMLAEMYDCSWIPRNNGDISFSLLPRRTAVSYETIARCEWELKSWSKDLLGVARYYPPLLSLDVDPESAETVVFLHQAILYILYLTAGCALYRPLVTSPLHSFHAHSMREELRGFAGEITTTLSDLLKLRLVCFVPRTCITAILFATATHLLDMKSRDITIRNQSRSHLDACMLILQQLQGIYPSSAQMGLSFSTVGAQKIGDETQCADKAAESYDV